MPAQSSAKRPSCEDSAAGNGGPPIARGVLSTLAMRAPSSAEVVELLGRVPVFSALEEADLRRIAQLAVPRSFDAGQVVFREGDRSDTCYVVHVGRARAVHDHGDGRTITLATFGSGDIFGELALFEDERRSATVEALEPTGVLAVLGPDMRRLMAEHPQIAMRLLIALARRLRESNERLARRSFQTVQSRVASALSELVAQAQEAQPRPLPAWASSAARSPLKMSRSSPPRLIWRSWRAARGSRRAASSRCWSGRGSSPRAGAGWSCTTLRRCARMSSERHPARARGAPGRRSAPRAGRWCATGNCW